MKEPLFCDPTCMKCLHMRIRENINITGKVSVDSLSILYRIYIIAAPGISALGVARLQAKIWKGTTCWPQSFLTQADSRSSGKKGQVTPKTL